MPFLLAVCTRRSGNRHRLRAWAKRLAVAELDIITCWITQPAVIADRVGLVTRSPDQTTRGLGLGGYGIDLLAAGHGKAEMAVIIGRQLPVLSAGHDHEDKFVLLAGFGHPDNPRTLAGALVNHRHGAELAVEGHAGVQVGDVQGQVGEGRAHGAAPWGYLPSVVRARRSG